MRHWTAFLALAALLAAGCEKDKITVVNNPMPAKDTVFVFETDTVFVHGDTCRVHWHHRGGLMRLAPNPMPNNHADENVGATLKGDVNLDGLVSFFDVAAADSAFRGEIALTAEQTANADINCDGALTYTEDVIGLLVYGAFIHGDNGYWCPFAEAVPCGLYTWPL